MTAELQASGAGCAQPERTGAERTVAAHREHVVGRLLARGLSAQTLIVLLPDFRPVVQRVVSRE